MSATLYNVAPDEPLRGVCQNIFFGSQEIMGFARRICYMAEEFKNPAGSTKKGFFEVDRGQEVVKSSHEMQE